MLPNLGALRLVPHTGAKDDVLEEIRAEIAERARLAQVVQKLGIDEVMLLLDQIGRDDASKAEVCQQVQSLCAISTIFREGCDAVDAKGWQKLAARLFPRVIRVTYTGPELRKEPRMNFFAMCYGYQLSQHVKFTFLRTAFEMEDEYVNYAFDAAARDAVVDQATSLPGKEEYLRIRAAGPLFDELIAQYINCTLRILLEHTPNASDTFNEDRLFITIDSVDETEYTIAETGEHLDNKTFLNNRLRRIGDVVGAHAVSCYKMFKSNSTRELDQMNTNYESMLDWYITDLFHGLFPSGESQGGQQMFHTDSDLQTPSRRLKTYFPKNSKEFAVEVLDFGTLDD